MKSVTVSECEPANNKVCELVCVCVNRGACMQAVKQGHTAPNPQRASENEYSEAQSSTRYLAFVLHSSPM